MASKRKEPGAPVELAEIVEVKNAGEAKKKAKLQQQQQPQSQQEKSLDQYKELRDALQNARASDVVLWMKDGTLIQLYSTDSFYTALATLTDAKILSAPIYDTEQKQYVGFIDVLDLTAAVVELVEVNETFKGKQRKPAETVREKEQGDSKEPGGKNQRRLRREYEEDDQDPFAEHLILESLSVKAIADFSQRDAFISVREDDDLLMVAGLLKDHHRVAVINDKGQLSGVITQTGLIEYITVEHGLIFDNVKRKVKDMNLPKQVYSVELESTTGLEALKKMQDERVSGLAVVNKNGTIVDAVSASDLMVWSEWEACGQPLRFRHLSVLNYNLEEFLQNSRAQSHHKDMKLRRGPIVCKPSLSIQEALEIMLANNIHRLFVVDSAHRPVSVLTYGDVITEIVDKTIST